MLQSVITTIPKSGKDPQEVQNYRPISLTNTDVKLYAKVIARRLLAFTPSLKNPDQVGFVPAQQAPGSTRRLISLIHDLEAKKCLLCFTPWTHLIEYTGDSCRLYWKNLALQAGYKIL